MSKIFKRNELDYILTDLLPLEKGNYYTHTFFYNFLLKRKRELDLFITTKKINIGPQSKQAIFNPKWHSTPLEFKVKNKKTSRTIYLMNPLGIVESFLFNRIYGDELLSIIHKKDKFGVRIPYKKSSLKYKKNDKDMLVYTDETDKMQIQYTLESSSYFYHHKPFSSISNLLESPQYQYFRDKFSLVMNLDIQSCFPSIYTHSFSWLIANKLEDRKSLSKTNSIYNIADVFLQNLNGSKTNGILVGPEVSRTMTEFLLCHLDDRIIKILSNKNLVRDEDYSILRFVDDYFIFSNNENDLNTISKVIEEVLNDFHLKINQNKLKISSTIVNDKDWYYEIKNIIYSIEGIFNKDYSDNISYYHLRNIIGGVISTSDSVQQSISYMLSTFVAKIEKYVSEDDSESKNNLSDTELLNTLFFIYRLSPTYYNTQKLIRCLSVLIEFNVERFTSVIERTINRNFQTLLDSYINDWVDLLLFCSSYNVNISNQYMVLIKDKVLESNDPHLIAGIMICVNKKKACEEFNKLVNVEIKSKLSMLNWKNFFSDKFSWWVFIFFSSEYLDEENKAIMSTNLNILSKEEKNIGKKLVLDFLINEKQHFIIWDSASENLYKQFYFFTRDRSLFNISIHDALDISY